MTIEQTEQKYANRIEKLKQEYATRIEELKREYALCIGLYKNMPRGQHFLEAIRNKDKYLVRSMLKTELTDASVSSDELLFLITFVAKEMPESLEPYNISKFYEAIQDADTDSTHWNKNYFLKQQSYLTLNFSVARFIHLVDVKEHINPILKAEQAIPNQSESHHSILAKMKKFAYDIADFSKENPKTAVAIAVLIVIGLVLFW